MPTIDETYFFAELNIPQKTDVANSLLMFINEHEERLLTGLLGYELHRDYKAGIAVAPTPDPKWVALRDGLEYTNRSGILTKWRGLIFTDGTGSGQAKKSLIANYVYWHWMQDSVSMSTANGEKVGKQSQAATDISPAVKMVRAWNQMVDWNKELVDLLLTKSSDYPQFQNHYGRISRGLLKKQNLLGI